MSDETKKSPKLRVLPEVLPAPTRADAETAVRARTIAHMKRLAAAAMAVGLGATACDSCMGYGVVDPMPRPADKVPQPKEDPFLIKPVTDPPDAGSKDATTTGAVPEPDHAYRVVDPLPPPPPPKPPKPPKKK